MSGYLLDTNVVSEIARQRNPRMAQIVVELDPAFLSVVTLHELEFGVRRMRDRAARFAIERRLMSAMTVFGQNVVPVTKDVALQAAEFRAQREGEGRSLDMPDAFIAATANLHDFTLVTRNVADFSGLSLAIENPFET